MCQFFCFLPQYLWLLLYKKNFKQATLMRALHSSVIVNNLLETQAHKHMQHVCRLLCNVFQSVASVGACHRWTTEELSMWLQCFSCCGGITEHSTGPFSFFNHCMLKSHCSALILCIFSFLEAKCLEFIQEVLLCSALLSTISCDK